MYFFWILDASTLKIKKTKQKEKSYKKSIKMFKHILKTKTGFRMLFFCAVSYHMYVVCRKKKKTNYVNLTHTFQSRIFCV